MRFAVICCACALLRTFVAGFAPLAGQQTRGKRSHDVPSTCTARAASIQQSVPPIDSGQTGTQSPVTSSSRGPNYGACLTNMMETLQQRLELQPAGIPQHLKQNTAQANKQDVRLSVSSFTAPKFRQIRFVEHLESFSIGIKHSRVIANTRG